MNAKKIRKFVDEELEKKRPEITTGILKAYFAAVATEIPNFVALALDGKPLPVKDREEITLKIYSGFWAATNRMLFEVTGGSDVNIEPPQVMIELAKAHCCTLPQTKAELDRMNNS
jgi:hypothetical protein